MTHLGGRSDPLDESSSVSQVIEGIEDAIVRILARDALDEEAELEIDCPHGPLCTRRHGPKCPGRDQAARAATWHGLRIVLEFDESERFALLEHELAGLDCDVHGALPILVGGCPLSRRAFIDVCCARLADAIEAYTRPSVREWTAETARRLAGADRALDPNPWRNDAGRGGDTRSDCRG